MQTAALKELDSTDGRTKWSWSCRGVDRTAFHLIPERDGDRPEAGDLGVFKVTSIGYHDTIMLADNRKVRIYAGDQIVGVFGNRYATDAYEAEVTGTADLSLLTAGGMVGTVLSMNDEMKEPTRLKFVAYLADSGEAKANLKRLLFRERPSPPEVKNLVVVVGTGMNSGKTTVARKLIRGLSEAGLRVAACKLTGSVSNRDQDEMRSAAAALTTDFSDYGFPSTYLASKAELMGLFHSMLADAMAVNPDVCVMEIADGILERETSILLANPDFRVRVGALALSAESSLSGIYGTVLLERMGYKVCMVSGMITSAPLYVKEFQSRSEVPVVSSAGRGEGLASVVREALCIGTLVGPEPQEGGGIEGEVYDYGSD